MKKIKVSAGNFKYGFCFELLDDKDIEIYHNDFNDMDDLLDTVAENLMYHGLLIKNIRKSDMTIFVSQMDILISAAGLNTNISSIDVSDYQIEAMSKAKIIQWLKKSDVYNEGDVRKNIEKTRNFNKAENKNRLTDKIKRLKSELIEAESELKKLK